MKNIMRNIVKKIYYILPYSVSINIRYIIEIILYKLNFKKNPWHSIKQKMIYKLQKKYKLNTFIETWTYMGVMVYAQLNNFNKIYSIELSKKYYNLAKKRFENNKNVFLILWDSSIELWKLINKINNQSLFFLDWHFSWWDTGKWVKECPLNEELDQFIKNKNKINNHIIMIDDIRLCWTDKDYPSIDELKQKLKLINNDYKIMIKNDQMIAYV